MSESLVAIVTGGAQGLGASISLALLKKDYKVCVADIQEEKGNQFVKDQQTVFGVGNVVFIVCDVTKETDYKEIFEFTLREFDRIDVVVNNAGIVCEKNARKAVDVNLMGPILGCQLAFKYMGKSNGGRGGMVINTASVQGFAPNYVLPVYTATKHGVIGLTRSYGHEYHLKRDGVLFTALCPALIETAIVDSIRTTSLVPGFDPYKFFDPMNPDYVAEGVIKLLEDRINGSTMVVTKSHGYQYIEYQEELKEFTP